MTMWVPEWFGGCARSVLFGVGCWFRNDCPCNNENHSSTSGKRGCRCEGDECKQNQRAQHTNCKCKTDSSVYGKCQPNSYFTGLGMLLILTVFVLALAYPYYTFPDKLASNLKAAFKGS